MSTSKIPFSDRSVSGRRDDWAILPTIQRLTQLREWFGAFDAEAWDRELEADARAGKLDALVEEALKARASGGVTKL